MENLSVYLKSVVDLDPGAVVICNLEHTILYMNRAAEKRYEKHGGAAMIGQSLQNCHNARSNEWIDRVLRFFRLDAENNVVYLGYRPKKDEDLYMIAIRDETGKLIGYYEKHALRTRDTAKPYDFSGAQV